MNRIVVRGARTHNLQSVDVTIPRGGVTVITGPSGSGKSSLAFDTIFVEGRRRYVESLSLHARRLLGPMARAPVESIEGLCPAIALEQRRPSRNPRSTVGTLTEIDEHLRLLFARAGEARCPRCGDPVSARSVPEIVDAILALGEGARATLCAPVVRRSTGRHADRLDGWRRDGFVRVRVDGAMRELGEDIALDPKKPHDIDLVIDRVLIKEGVRPRVLDAVELALKVGDGTVRVSPVDGPELVLSERFACPRCGITLPPVEPALFSFNAVEGACTVCHGLGYRSGPPLAELVPDPSRSLRQGALAPFGPKKLPPELERYARSLGVDLDAPWSALPGRARDEIIHGDGHDFVGVITLLQRTPGASGRDDDPESEAPDEPDPRWSTPTPCDACNGARLRPEALSVLLGAKNIAELTRMRLAELRAFLQGLSLPERARVVTERVHQELVSRLEYLDGVGLPYLSLDRPVSTLSTGETQRVRLATQLGASLSGVLYVLDEPTLGLHPRDAERLLESVRGLVTRGNTVVLVEHDLEAVRGADHVIDMGPAAGQHGGRVVGEGTPAELAEIPTSVTGPWLSGARGIPAPSRRRTPVGSLRVEGATLHNLRDLTVEIPLGVMVAVTGVSGSGKSSLVLGTLVPHVAAGLGLSRPATLPPLRKLTGAERVDRLVAVDARPLGRSPRATAATYMGIFSLLRELFATLPEARARGFKPGRFSNNVKGGRCELCQGEGTRRVAMHFLPDVAVVCEACKGKRYEEETLAVRFRGHSIADVLELTVDAAAALFENLSRIRDLLLVLHDVGLGYLHIGQAADTLSGGESQRVRLARELGRRPGRHTLYVLDEPTAGLHLTDIEVLLGVLERLVDQGHTVLVIEHDMNVVKRADHVIDVGPGAAENGGTVVAVGTPEAIALHPASATAEALRAALGPALPVSPRKRPRPRA